MKATKIKKEIEYEEAPSGYVTFYNYKEPLMRFTGGTGFVGVLAFDGESDKIQCHLCGEWFGSLPPHLMREHAMRADAYKEMVGLNKTTALISETTRAKLIASGLEKRMKNLRPGKSPTVETRKKIGETLKKNSMENQNLRGTCPAQLIDRLYNRYLELGRTPTQHELTFHTTLIKVYGSMGEACRIAGIPYRKSGVTVAREEGRDMKHTKEQVLEYIRNFHDTNNRLPKWKDAGDTLWKNIKRFGHKEIIAESLGKDGKYRRCEGNLRYSREQLLKFLVSFEKINDRNPSYSDCKRGLLPHLSRYSYHFGSWKNALKLAGL